MASKKSLLAFTLLELIVAVAILAILMFIAIPTYQKYVYTARRHEAMSDILKLQLLEERYRNYNPSYASLATLQTYNGGNLPITTSSSYYTFLIDATTVSATNYVIQATAVGSQQNDTADGTSCITLTINAQGTKTPSACWNK